jgi:hypothetical protein
MVFDGLNPIVGPRMLSMNHRFASPGGLVGLYELGSEGTNWWSSYNDVARGQGRHSLLDRCLKDNRCPKIAEILARRNSGTCASPILSAVTRRHPAARQCAALLQCRCAPQWRPRRF